MPLVSLERGWQSPELRCTITRTASLSDLQAAFVMDSARTKASCSGCVPLRRGWTTPEPPTAHLARRLCGARKASGVVRPLALRHKRPFARISTVDEDTEPKDRAERVNEIEKFLKIHRAPISSLDFVFVEPLSTLQGKCGASSSGKMFSAGDTLVKSASSSSKKQRREIVAEFYQQHDSQPAEKKDSPTSVTSFPEAATIDGQAPAISTRKARRDAYQKWLLSKRAPLPVSVAAR